MSRSGKTISWSTRNKSERGKYMSESGLNRYELFGFSSVIYMGIKGFFMDEKKSLGGCFRG
jgi:hypothetical protein